MTALAGGGAADDGRAPMRATVRQGATAVAAARYDSRTAQQAKDSLVPSAPADSAFASFTFAAIRSARGAG